MRRVRLLGKSAAVAAAVLALIQLIPVSRTNPPVTADLPAAAAVKSLLRRACYDCHSNETRWPWYSRVAPISWLVANHVREGRKDLNFSEWPIFDFEAQDLARADITAQLAKGKMPPRSYKLGHPEARLNKRERAILLEWARTED